jgi:RNA polymerase sigma-70 factor (ECF subfamily)
LHSEPTFEELVTPLLDRAYGVALNLCKKPGDAENLVQEASLRAFRAFKTFQQGTNFRAWFLRILTNCFYEECRRSKNRPEPVESDELLDHFLLNNSRALKGTGDGDPVASFFSRFSLEQIHEAMDRLPQEFRVAAALYFQDDQSYLEIAEVLDSPLGTVRSRIHRARKLLQKALWDVAVEAGIVKS